MLTIQESFKRFREQFNLTKTDIVNALNIKLPSYKYEDEKTRYPGGETLIKLSTAFNVSTDYLLGLTDEPRPFKSTTQDTPSEKPVVKESAPMKLQVIPPNVPREKPVESLQSRLARIESALTANGIQL